MTRPFQLVFRSGDGGEQVETHDSNLDGELHIDGRLVVGGEVFTVRGVDWLLTADDLGDTKRFLCTLVAVPADPGDAA
jgi:hypothetical protein